MAMSSGRVVSDGGASDGPTPREVYRAAREGRRISISVQPHGGGDAITISGDITGRRKAGNDHTVSVTVQFVPDSELAPVEIEATEERGQWGPFRAFQWSEGWTVSSGTSTWYQFLGTVDSVDLPGERWSGDASSSEGGEGVSA